MKLSEQLLAEFFRAYSIDGYTFSEPLEGLRAVTLLKEGEALPGCVQKEMLTKMVGFPYVCVKTAIDHILESKNNEISKISSERVACKLPWIDTYRSVANSPIVESQRCTS
jgi:hypothetical protein